PVGCDEEDVSVAAAEAEVDGARQLDLADQRAVSAEHLDAGECRGVHTARAVDLEAVGEARCRDGEQPIVDQTIAGHVERADVMRPAWVEAFWLVVRTAVADVQDALVRRERESIRLVEVRSDDDRLPT